MHTCGHIPCTADTRSGGCYSLSIVPACFSLVDHPDNYVRVKPLKWYNQFATNVHLVYQVCHEQVGLDPLKDCHD